MPMEESQEDSSMDFLASYSVAHKGLFFFQILLYEIL